MQYFEGAPLELPLEDPSMVLLFSSDTSHALLINGDTG
jgi:hypothetical protein